MKFWAVACVAVLGSTAWAASPSYDKSAFIFGVEAGPGIWGLDRAKLANQVGQGDADLFVNEAQNGPALTVRAAFNILGHATIGAELTGTGWNIGKSNNGGAGFLAGVAAWHPLQLIPALRDRPADGSLFFGLGYGIAGEDRGMDGLVEELGLRANYFFTPWFSVNAFARWILLSWNNFYIDYNNRSLPGNTVPLPNGSGGDFFTFGIGLELRLVP